MSQKGAKCARLGASSEAEDPLETHTQKADSVINQPHGYLSVSFPHSHLYHTEAFLLLCY